MNKFFLVSVLLSLKVGAQVSIVNIPFQAINVTPESLLEANILNTEGEKQVQLFVQLIGSDNSILISVNSQPFQVVKGLNGGRNGVRRIATLEYGSSKQSNYIKNTHTLPTGKYRLCAKLISYQDAYKADEYCEEIESDFNQYLYLLYPFNEDSVDTQYPILSWMHNEPFSVLNNGESFRIVVSEIKRDQSSEEAITVNTPVMMKNNLKDHQLQYPYDAKELFPGKQYAWQVQKLANGVIVNKTEAWKFNVRYLEELHASKYVNLKSQLDGSFYTASNGIAYFKFFEEYKGEGKLSYQLTNSKSQILELNVELDSKSHKRENSTGLSTIKSNGNNLYALDLNGANLSSGFYTLLIKNEKNESFYLKIFLP